jgi:DNA-binding NarL/FixJ family response regulator
MPNTVLIVDDNNQFLEAARDLLEQQGAHVVAVASKSADAIRLARDLRPDCVLVDVELGPESGFELAQRLVTDHCQRVVLISVYSEGEFADLIASSPAAGFITKAQLSVRRIADVLDDGRAPAT